MNVQVEIAEVPLGALSELRSLYLDGLAEAQEAFLEALIAGARGYELRVRGEVAGYGLVRDDALLEFFVTDAFLPPAHLLFRKLVLHVNVARALVKSFDHLFLACAMDVQVGVRVLGILVREFAPRDLPPELQGRYTQRAATEADLPRLMQVEQDVFNDAARMARAIADGRVRVFEHGSTLVGFGLLKPVRAGHPEVDVGLVVDRPFRSRGHAAYILRDLVDHCLASGLRPVSGCAANNYASINLGLRVGFISRYRLLELQLRAP